MEVSKIKQLQYLKRKYKDLSKQYFYELTEGNNLIKIRDISFVLNTIKKEIAMLERGVRKERQLLDTMFR